MYAQNVLLLGVAKRKHESAGKLISEMDVLPAQLWAWCMRARKKRKLPPDMDSVDSWITFARWMRACIPPNFRGA